jgi:hypothetical protein
VPISQNRRLNLPSRAPRPAKALLAAFGLGTLFTVLTFGGGGVSTASVTTACIGSGSDINGERPRAQTFRLIRHRDGTVSLLSLSDHKYVAVVSSGNLSARASTVHRAQEFDFLAS